MFTLEKNKASNGVSHNRTVYLFIHREMNLFFQLLRNKEI